MKLFVSSTYLDLQDYRKCVDEIINRLESQYRGMEYFGSRPSEPKKVCFDEISKCDIFVGIYAHRYGFISKGDSSSITEQEFDFAQSLGIPCYCYVVSPTYPWPPQLIESEASIKLQKFLRKINKLVRSTFTTPDNLAKQVAADLVNALQQPYFESYSELQTRIQTFAWQEITNTIGPKYIRELYVNRGLNKDIQQQVRLDQRLPKLLAEIGKQTANIYETLLNTGTLEKDVKKNEEEKKKIEKITNVFKMGSETCNFLRKCLKT